MRFVLVALAPVFLIALGCTMSSGGSGKKKSDATSTAGEDTVTFEDAVASNDAGSGADGEGAGIPDDVASGGIFSCYVVVQCVQKTCPTEPSLACMDGCAAELHGPNAALYQELRACSLDHCTSACAPADYACWTLCTSKHCASAFIACAEDGGAGDKTCKAVWDCSSTSCLNQDGPGCLADCIQGSDTAAHTAFADVMACVGQAGLAPTGSTESVACLDPVATCACPDSGTPGSGAGSCALLITCQDGCQGDLCCSASCAAMTSTAAWTAGKALFACFTSKCTCATGDANCATKCATGPCSAEFYACECPGVPKPGSGDKGCKAFLDCQPKCGSDVCCLAGCAGKLNASAMQTLEKLVACLPKCGCKGNDSACLEQCGKTTCQPEAMACYFDA